MDYWITFLSGMLTPIIAIVMTYIAIQQYRLNRFKIRHDLYEPRMKIYRSIMEFYTHIIQNGAPIQDDIGRLIRETSECQFLFKGNIKKHIDQLYKGGIDMQEINLELDDRNLQVGERRTQLAHKQTNLFRWFRKQMNETRRLFQKYLRVDV